jgi:hypothetical protein
MFIGILKINFMLNSPGQTHQQEISSDLWNAKINYFKIIHIPCFKIFVHIILKKKPAF